MSSLDTKALLAHIIEDGGTVVVTTDEFSSLPQTVSNDRILAEHVVVNEVLTNPSAQTADWKVVTANGSLTIDVDLASPTDTDRTNAINGTTAITLYLNPTDTMGKSGTLVLEKTGISSLPVTITNSSITANHVCIKSVLSNPSAQTADWLVTTSDGSLVISSDAASAISGTTDLTLYMTIET